jgi:Flp pilus assembly protein TadG
MKTRLHSRRNQGSAAALAFVAVVPLVAAIGGFAVDCMHFNDAKGELQRATDAAALGGAQDLQSYNGTGIPASASSYSAANNEPLNFALATAAMNAVDGPIGLWSSSNRSITATIRYDSNFPGTPTWPNRCDVATSVHINSLFERIIGNFGQNVNARASASMFPVTTVTTPAPLLVSIKDFDQNGHSVQSPGPGNTLTINIKDNESSNAVWIFNNNTLDEDLLNHLIDPVKYPTLPLTPVTVNDHTIGGVEINDIIKSDNGTKSAGKLFDQLVGKDIILLVTDASYSDNNYTAKGTPVRTVIGFIGMHVSAADNTNKGNGYSLTGTLKPVSAIGTSNSGLTNPFTGFAPYIARLIE